VTSLTAFESFICSADVLGHVMVGQVNLLFVFCGGLVSMFQTQNFKLNVLTLAICFTFCLLHLQVWDVSNMTVIQDLRNSPYPVKHLCLYGVRSQLKWSR